MAQKPVPIILVGKGNEIGRGVIESLKPDYEGNKTPLRPSLLPPISSPAPCPYHTNLPPVVSYITSREASIAEIPFILNGKAPPDPSTTLGSGNLADRPVVIVTGGAFTEGFDDLHDAVEYACGPTGSGLIWLKSDTSKPGPGVFTAEYPKSVAERVKSKMGELMEGGEIHHVEGSVHFY